MSRGTLSDPVMECWTSWPRPRRPRRRVRVGSFVTNVMNRHPGVLARMAATVADLAPAGRAGDRHRWTSSRAPAYGIDFPAPPERAARLEEAIGVIRALWSGGPVDFDGRFYRSTGAHAFPVPTPAPDHRGRREARRRPAGRARGDAWTCADAWPTRGRCSTKALADAGRRREEVAVIVGCDLPPGDAARTAPP